jgi:hypothetical protein
VLECRIARARTELRANPWGPMNQKGAVLYNDYLISGNLKQVSIVGRTGP